MNKIFILYVSIKDKIDKEIKEKQQQEELLYKYKTKTHNIHIESKEEQLFLEIFPDYSKDFEDIQSQVFLFLKIFFKVINRKK